MTQLNLLVPKDKTFPHILAENFNDGYAVKKAYRSIFPDAPAGAFSMVIPWGNHHVAKICTSKETTLAYLQLCMKFKEKGWYMPSWMLRVESLHIYNDWYWAVLEKLVNSSCVKNHHEEWWSKADGEKYPHENVS